MNKDIYDIAIIGGGLAGLSLAIQAGQCNYKVLLIEKESYPFHKVCGEYISLESWPFIESLGVPLSTLKLPIITQLNISGPNGKILNLKLPQGGFGISRYFLDNYLKNIAIEKNIRIIEQTKVEDVVFNNDIFLIKTGNEIFESKICCGSFGKRSNLDIKWKRPFISSKNVGLNNYIGIKYHLKINYPDNLISLHNFKDGYCGISKIEDDKYCLCYLTTAKNLKENNSIELLEKNILSENPFLKIIFENAEFLYKKPETIAQISFSKKSQIENHVLMLGDAAGMITPLCGNGMSMALHGSKLAFEQINLYLQKKIDMKTMEDHYKKNWQLNFKLRLFIGRTIQRFFGKKWITNLFVSILNNNKFLSKQIVKLTHGKPF